MPSRVKINPISTEFVNPLRSSSVLGRSLLDILLPPSHNFGRSDNHLDWSQFTFLDDPCCDLCGFPFEFDQGAKAICGACAGRTPIFDKCRAAFTYNDHSRPYILAFKHGGRTMHLDRFARQLQRAGHPFWKDADMIVPVPLHRSRLIKRRFNQAALLARALSQHVSIPFEPEILFRHKATISQGGQSQKGRFRNVKGAFTVPETAQLAIKDKVIVLIDDVMTTGATLESCAKALKRAGAQKVYALTLSRVVRAQQIPT